MVIELKNTVNEDIGIIEGFNQLQTYKNDIPSLFYYNAFMITSDGINAKAGTITSDIDRFMFWRTIDGEKEASGLSQLQIMLFGMMDKKRFLDIISKYSFFVHEENKSFKILPGYHQFYAVNKALYSSHIATSENGNRKVGVIWHTQGSGKSYSMLMYARQLVLELNNPTIIVITDRNDLDDQLFTTFSKSSDYLRQTPKRANSRKELRDLLNVQAGGIIFTTIQKFSPDESDEAVEALTMRRNVVVIADEAHRSQYGLDAKEKDGKISFGFAKYMRDTLPNASFIGFTGTPVELADKNTPALFGDYIDIYDLTQAVKDKTTVPIYYESRIAKLDIPQELKPKIDEEYDAIFEGQEETYTESQKRKWARLEAIVGTDSRIDVVVKDFLAHYEMRQQAINGKVMFVTISRKVAVKLYSKIIQYRPEWHSEDINKGVIKIVMTSRASDPQEFQPHSTSSSTQKKVITNRMKDINDELKIVIVCDMWLTGFDVPCLHTMYIDKPMSGHNLMQAIARVNRVFKDKPGGLIVDYIGIAYNLRTALAQYTPSDRKTTGIDPQLAIDLMLEKYEQIIGLLHGLDYSLYLTGSPSDRINCIVLGIDFILGKTKEEKKEFLNLVTEISKAYALCSTYEQAQKINIDISYFKAIKSGIIKIIPKDRIKKTKDQIEYEISQLVSKSVISEEVVDILESVGLNKPDISILSDEFLEEIKGLPQKNLALELLKRLLDGKIKSIAKKNIVQAKKFSELLEASVIQYEKRSLETAEVIKALVDMAKDMNELYKRGEELGLSKDELAFYDAISSNDAARDFYENDILKQIAKELTISIKNSIKVDWDIRESVRAQMRITIKRLLRKYKYPHDKQTAAVNLIIEQAEKLCSEELD